MNLFIHLKDLETTLKTKSNTQNCLIKSKFYVPAFQLILCT